MKPLTEINKDYFKIAVEQAVLDNLLGNGKITLDEKYYHKRSIKLMKEAQEFGKQQQAKEFEKKVKELKEDIEKLVYSGSDFYLDNVKLVLKEIDKIFSDNGDNSPATNPKKNIQIFDNEEMPDHYSQNQV